MDHDRLVNEASRALRSAYAPYSGFRVGAALLSADGSISLGCNVENASYGLTVCAERVAVQTAVARGERDFVAIAIATEGPAPVAPCGACRQVLAEFAPDLTVISDAGGDRRTWTLGELLPERFGASQVWLSRTDEKAK
jgi:cytidine deaminase